MKAKMPFTRRTLGEICDQVGGVIRTGPFGSQLHESDYQDEGLPVVMPKDIVDGRISTDGVARIGEQHELRLAQHKMKRGDIVYGRRGDIGRRALITERESGWLCGTGCLRISLGDSVLDPAFLFYFLGQPDVVAWIGNQAIGATLPNLNTAIIRSVPISYPTLLTQRKIATILSAYDDFIENNARRIKILEQMARLIYDEWFVKFRFPGHEKVKMVDSGLGPIPDGWKVLELGKAVELAYGKALKESDRREGPFPVYGSSGIIGYHSASLASGPGIIVGRKGNVGSVHWSDGDFYPIDTVYFVKTEIPLYYVFLNLKKQNFINSDAAVPGLNRNYAYSLPFLQPSEAMLTSFVCLCEPIFSQSHNLKTTIANLRPTRDLLLLKLISGEIDVENLDIAIPEAAPTGEALPVASPPV